MSVQRNLTLLFLALGLVPRPAAAQNIKKFLDDVRPILLPDEEKQWKGLKDNRDREEFARIFWARRDPDLEAPGNEYQKAYEAARADASKRFVGAGRAGADTDCGRVFILLGAPDEAFAGVGTTGRKLEEAKLVRESQTWVYRDREGIKFKDGQVEITFDDACSLPQGARLSEQLARIAESKIAHPNIDYRKGADGHIVKLEEQLPKPSPVMALLKTPRQDFPAASETELVLRTPDGATYVAGLVRMDPGVLPADARPVIGAQALGADGRVAATHEREVAVQEGPDGAVISWGMSLKPGDYTMRVGVLDPKTNKGSAIEKPLKVPDFNAEELSLSPLLVLRDVIEAPADPKAALSAFQLGTTRLVPRFGNVFATTDSVTLLGFIYGGRPEGPPPGGDKLAPGQPQPRDPATGRFVESGDPAAKRSVAVTFSILKDGQPVAKAPEQTYDATPTGPSVGPVPLTNYKPGQYVAQMTVKDNISKKEYKGEAKFEVK